MFCTFNAHDVMQQMGLRLPFDKKNKELSGIVEQKHLNDKNLYVSKILQSSVIKVDEKGTEAAAVTTVMAAAALSCPCPPPPARFVADHPFMFMIRENTSGTVFFSGVVVNPVATNWRISNAGLPLFARKELGFPYYIKFLLFTFLYAALISPSPLVLEIYASDNLSECGWTTPLCPQRTGIPVLHQVPALHFSLCSFDFSLPVGSRDLCF
ncbi:serpin-ZX [Tanacetum coccineum]